MTVTELHAALAALIEQGHGELYVCYPWRDKMESLSHWGIDELQVVADHDDPSKQVAEVS